MITSRLPKVDQDEGLAGRAVEFRLGMEARHIYDCKFRHMLCQLLRIHFADKHVAGEKVMPGILSDNAYGHLVAGIGAHVTVKNKDIAVLDVSP